MSNILLEKHQKKKLQKKKHQCTKKFKRLQHQLYHPNIKNTSHQKKEK